jgi:hypothetical protein
MSDKLPYPKPGSTDPRPSDPLRAGESRINTATAPVESASASSASTAGSGPRGQS